MTKRMIIAVAGLTALALSGCAVPQYLVEDTFVGGRSMKTILTPAATVGSGNNQTVLYNYGIRLCDLDANGAESTCQTTTILSNVIAGSVY